jgi:hypothetical protein
MQPIPICYKLKVAAAISACSVTTLRRAIRRGDLKASTWMRHIIVTDDELRRFIKGDY